MAKKKIVYKRINVDISDSNILEVIKELQRVKQMAIVDNAHLAPTCSIILEIESNTVPGMADAYIKTETYVTYKRLETDNELKKRLKEEMLSQLTQEDHERKLFDRLSKKFGKKGKK